MRTALLPLALVALAACNPNAPSCLASPPAPPALCPPAIYVDTTTNDPICFDGMTGLPICRGSATYCYVCTGAQFTDGCLAQSVETYECVHDCSRC